MAPKHSDKLPASSSSDEEEHTASEAEEEDEETSDEEQEQSQINKPEISSPLTTATEANESSESDGSDSETGSDSVPEIKPIATKPMVDSAKQQQSAAKPSTSGAKSMAKRQADSKSDQKESKRVKKESVNGREEAKGSKNDSEDGEEKGKKTGDDAKKQLFQRIWSEEDEIAVLKGMIEFKSERGTDPAADVNAFYEFIKNSLHMDFGIARLKDKMWRLKKKFKNNVKRGKGDAFTKAHDQEAYNLSKKIWVADDEILKAESLAQSNGKAKRSQHVAVVKATPEASSKEMSKKHDVPLDKMIGVGSIEGDVLSRGMDLIPSDKKAALEERWKKLRIAEMELFLQRNELVSEQAKCLLDFYKSGKN